MKRLPANSFRTVASSTSVADDAVVPYYLSDRKVRIAIARVDGRLYAFDDLCTCVAEPCPLSGGLLVGTTLTCQCHGSQFDIHTGDVISGPAIAALNRYEVHEADGRIRVCR
jgi:nitrite reductase/ring-hydroxylating ferredoxin subunit